MVFSFNKHSFAVLSNKILGPLIANSTSQVGVFIFWVPRHLQLFVVVISAGLLLSQGKCLDQLISDFLLPSLRLAVEVCRDNYGREVRELIITSWLLLSLVPIFFLHGKRIVSVSFSHFSQFECVFLHCTYLNLANSLTAFLLFWEWQPSMGFDCLWMNV